MNVEKLVPQPEACEPFRRNRQRFVPRAAGCYALTTFTGTVLYVGLASSLHDRMGDHLDSAQKTAVTELGRAVMFFWFETPDLNKIERTWMNIHIQAEGALPILNRAYSPVAT
jgi:hypothetical protein